MYLSSIHLRLDMPSVRQCLADAQDMHRNIMNLFGQEFESQARKRLGIVYRMYKTPGGIRLYLLSADRPDESRLPPGFDMPEPSKDLAGVVKNFAAGQSYRFDLLASPVKKVAAEGKNSKRVFLTDPKQRLDWLNRKAAVAGFRVDWVREQGTETVRAALKKKDAAITCMGVQFVGLLTVTDEKAFTKAYSEGIGVQKAYGFGLLLLAPAHDGA
ncbi:MAG: type I-E CRISPR-associated protein Cas6/Cse3/CasE [Eubacteriales bacterium]|nr:type I-E CRISPR-associated protein Cas6/Cse3/CasE [Eubacteriales bacterium]